MDKTLLIVESPAKAKTIGRYLGKDYLISASVGHIRDLPANTLGVDVNHDYKPMYITMPGKDKVISEMRQAAKKSQRILLATDPDREGEAIAFHLAHILKIDPASDCRVSFNEITERAVKAALETPRPIDMNLVDAQQSRRILDRLVGYELSPLLWKKVRRGLSAGRVQSVATRLIVLREREIEAFIPEEYWVLTALLSTLGEKKQFSSRYHGEKRSGKVKKIVPSNREEVDLILADIKDKVFLVDEVKKRVTRRQPGAPFTTSTLQQDASRLLGFTASRTMRIAQQLYEGVTLPELGQTALVTYIRTDSVRVSNAALNEGRSFIEKRYGREYLSPKPRYYRNKNASQDAHEAIRPAHFELPPDKLAGKLTPEQQRLYKLIWDRFIASQMANAEFDSVTVDVTCGVQLFRAKGETMKFAGFHILWQSAAAAENEDNQVLPELTEGEQLKLEKMTPEQKFTQPPPRYTEATLIKALEEFGIGRPSTYAPTIATIVDRQYVEREARRVLKPTELGRIVTELLEEHFENIVDTEFTATMESNLDTVESGERDWVGVIDEFYPPFHQQILAAEKTIEKVYMPVIETGEKCPKCEEGDLLIKEGRYGKFISCSRYPDCDYSSAISEKANVACPLCGSEVLIKTARRRRKKFYVCDKKGKDKDCPFISWDLPAEGKNCQVCGSYMVEKRYGRNVSLRCSNKECETNAKKSKAKKTKTGKTKQDGEVKTPVEKAEAENKTMADNVASVSSGDEFKKDTVTDA